MPRRMTTQRPSRLSRIGFDRYPTRDSRDVAQATFRTRGHAVPQRTVTLGVQSGAKVCVTRFGCDEGRSRIRQMCRLRQDDPILLTRGARWPAGRRVPPAEWLQSPDDLPGGTGLCDGAGAAVRSRGIGQTTYWGLPGPITTVVARPALLQLDLTGAGSNHADVGPSADPGAGGTVTGRGPATANRPARERRSPRSVRARRSWR
jgi:hypothetical protein